MIEKIVAKTKHGEITIDQLAEVQPGMARLMDELGKRLWYLYYSAKGGNWKLAAHNVGEARALFRIASIVRPKYASDLDEFNKLLFEGLSQTIVRQNWDEFEVAFKETVEASDAYHDKYGFNYIRFVLPSIPPPYLDLGPPEKLRKAKNLPSH